MWASFLSDVELKLQILMEPINFNINFRGVIPINDICDALPNPKNEQEYLKAIANASVVAPSDYCINILLVQSSVKDLKDFSGKKKIMAIDSTRIYVYQGYFEQLIFMALKYNLRGHDIPDQFDAYPIQIWKWLEYDVCSPLEAFPQHSFNVNSSYTSVAEYCKFWYGGSVPQTNDICEKQDCKAEILKYIPVVYVYPSYNLPCGAERICVQGRCLPAGVQIELNLRRLCLESNAFDISSTVTATKCLRRTNQDQTFMLVESNDVGFQIQIRSFGKNFGHQCLTVDTNKIVLKDCNQEGNILTWRFLYNTNDAGYLLNHVATKTFVTVEHDGDLVLSSHCNHSTESQRWRINQVEGNQLMDTRKIQPQNDFVWLFEKDYNICPSRANADSAGNHPERPRGLKFLSFNVLGSITIVGLILALFISVYMWIRYKRKTASIIQQLSEQFYRGDIEHVDKTKWLNEQLECIPFSREWEFPVENVIIGENIGCGAFGTVMKGCANGIIHKNVNTDIAIKMCRSSGKQEHFEALASEMKILAYLGSHENIVQLLGVSANGQNLMVLLEYCTNGSLKQFLSKNRDSYGTDVTPNETRDFLGYTLIHPSGSLEGKPYTIRPLDLNRWAAEIAAGMEYMVEKRVLHADLAARNVLLGDGLTAKICDFGLSQKLLRSYNYKHNRQTASTLLPLKWMAIESIELGIFSSHSDVWSFGVLLWEIFTLGMVPYTGLIMNARLIDRIKNGFRLQKPPHCTDEAYQIMSDCWCMDPDSRPSFTDLRLFFTETIDRNPQLTYTNTRSHILLGTTDASSSIEMEIMV